MINHSEIFFIDTTYSSTMNFGTTIAGGCNGSASTNQTTLSNLGGVMLDYNNTLYVGDLTNRFFAFEPNNRTGRVLRSYPNFPTFSFLDNKTSNIYITIFSANLVYIWPTNKTIPPNGISYSTCSMNWMFSPAGIAVDSSGNVYIVSYSCNWVTKWAPNATNGTLVVGSASATAGSDSLSLSSPNSIALDEANSFLYVVDRHNHRIQRFVLGSSPGVTVAGGNGAGTAANQFDGPTDIYLSKLDGSIYICDCYNNRIQKWQKNATNGTTVAGSPNGLSGSTPYFLNQPYGIASDDQENYVYVSDSGNSRVQRFSLH
jgi:sugar lactone lactonase YvrE